MKLQANKKSFSLLLFFISIPTYSSQYEINFFEAFDEVYILEVIHELKYESNIKKIKILLDQKKWIERYEIQRNFFKPSSINIVSRKPILVWNDKNFVDRNFFIFPKKESSSSKNILKINCPESLLEEVFKWINYPIDEAENKLLSINYDSLEGWIFKFEDFEAKLGKNLDTKKFENLLKTIEYLYEKRKNPSIVDLRSDAGISLKYDK
mgnify:FL=1|tara:strand:- start:1009 stop:1635 length:627 start_codon:yes stop_codon:yes gene_type:complete